MKISKMTNEQASEAIIRIASPMANILDDDKSKPILDEIAGLAENSGMKSIASVLPKIVAFCFQEHKGDLYEIIGALTLKPSSKVGNMNFMQTIKELKESIDEDFVSFFKSSGNATATPGEE